jgi:large subunit ribosomal protein L25
MRRDLIQDLRGQLPGGAHPSEICGRVQRDPVARIIEHIDLLVVRKGEKITVDVTVHIEGESAPGTIHILESATLSIAAEATHLPEYVTVDIEGFEEGDKVLAGDVTLPDGSELEDDPEMLVVAISVPRQSIEDEEAEAAEAAEAEEAEGEEGDGDGDSDSGDSGDSDGGDDS